MAAICRQPLGGEGQTQGVALRTVWESFDLIPEIEIDGDGVLAIPDRSFFQPRLL